MQGFRDMVDISGTKKGVEESKVTIPVRTFLHIKDSGFHLTHVYSQMNQQQSCKNTHYLQALMKFSFTSALEAASKEAAAAI